MKDETVGSNEKNKFVNKIDNLETELKEFRKKARDQKNMEKLVSNQSGKIKDLATEIKKFKVQKMELGRKMKEEKESFQKFKTKKVKELINARKENMKKDTHIKKLMMENARKNQSYKKKEEELHRAKRINETLKNLVKPSSNNMRKASDHRTHEQSFDMQSSKVSRLSQGAVTEKSCEEHILRCIRKIITQIDQDKVITKYELKIKSLTEEIKFLLSEESTHKLKLERILIKADNFTSEEEELTE